MIKHINKYNFRLKTSITSITSVYKAHTYLDTLGSYRATQYDRLKESLQCYVFINKPATVDSNYNDKMRRIKNKE